MKAGDLWGRPHAADLSDGARVVACCTGLLSIGAGVIHVSAAADHENLPVMMAGFIAIAWAQVGLGALLFARRPSRLVLAAAAALMVGAVATWVVSRTAGLPFLPGGHMEPIGFKDATTVLFEIAAIPGLLLLMSDDLGSVRLPSPRLGQQAIAGLGVGLFSLFVPALVLGGGGHHSADQHAAMGGHAHGEEVASTDAGGHAHGDGEVAGAHASGGDDHDDGHAHGEGDDEADAELSQRTTGHEHDDDDADESDSGSGGDDHDDHDSGGDDHDSGGGRERNRGGHDHGDERERERGGDDGGSGHEHGSGDEGGSGDDGSGDDGGHDHGGGSEPEPGDHGHGGGDGHGGGGGGHGGGHGSEPTDPPIPAMVTKRAETMQPKPAGTRQTVKLQYGPFVLPPGSDASQVGVEAFGADGFIVGAKPSLRYGDGTEVAHGDGVHLHHAHLFRRDGGPNDASDGYDGIQWVFGTGDEQTAGSFELISDAADDGRRVGVPLYRGDPMLMVWMPMNMTRHVKVVYLEFAFDFVHGSAAEIERATGVKYTALKPVLMGETFNVPKTGGFYAWPRDASRSDAGGLTDSQWDPETFMTPEPANGRNIVPGVGHIWTAPADGVLVGAAGHMHEGGAGVVFSNLGTEESPCADDGDGFAGTRIFESSAYYAPGAFPSHLKMGTTQPGWRAYVRKGDRIAINGVYDTREYAWPDQMSVVGFYVDPTAEVPDAKRCNAELVNEPGAGQDAVTASVPFQTAQRGDDGASLFHMEAQHCVADGCNDYNAPPLPRGPRTTTITIDDFTFTPGDLKPSSLVGGTLATFARGAPVVKRGERIRFVNLDYVAFGGTRHAVTSCHGPCNGPEAMTYPNSNGAFYSGPIGYVPLAETASSENQAAPVWELDTSKLEPGYHAYYCFQHRWMRGAFYLE